MFDKDLRIRMAPVITNISVPIPPLVWCLYHVKIGVNWVKFLIVKLINFLNFWSGSFPKGD